jgi:Tfp pilus assembly protein PilF
VDEFRRAVAARPDSVPALLALGESWLEADKPRSSVEPLETAARLDAKSGRAQLLLGTAYQSLGRTADAAKAYQRYLEIDPRGDFAADVRVILANLDRRR